MYMYMYVEWIGIYTLIFLVHVGETPVLLVGLINGGVEMIEVLRDSGASASPPEIQTSRIEARGTGRHNYTHTQGPAHTSH